MSHDGVSPYDLPAIHRGAKQNARIKKLLHETVGQWQAEQAEKARKFRREWSHQPTPIPPNASGLWYSEDCVDQMLVDYSAAAPKPPESDAPHSASRKKEATHKCGSCGDGIYASTEDDGVWLHTDGFKECFTGCHSPSAYPAPSRLEQLEAIVRELEKAVSSLAYLNHFNSGHVGDIGICQHDACHESYDLIRRSRELQP
jgi:hypothetical protein